MFIDEHGGRVEVIGKDGKPMSGIGTDEYGGIVGVMGKDENLGLSWVSQSMEATFRSMANSAGLGLSCLSVNTGGVLRS